MQRLLNAGLISAYHCCNRGICKMVDTCLLNMRRYRHVSDGFPSAAEDNFS